MIIEPENEILLVAYYRSLDMAPEAIGRLLGFSIPTISRRLKEARDKGYLREVHVFNPGNRLEAIYPYLSDHQQADKFLRFFGRQTLQNVIIVPRTFPTPQDNLRLVGRAAAVHFADVLRGGYVVGVSFGRTILEMVRAAQELYGAGEWPTKDIEFVPLLGGLSVLPKLQPAEAFECAASSLASELARVFKGHTTGQLFLPTPAFVPTGFLTGDNSQDMNERIRVAQEFVSSIPEYQMIFGTKSVLRREPAALIGKMDIMVTSVGGPLSQQSAPQQDDTQQSEAGWLSTGGPIINERERYELARAGVVGDICGHFISETQVTGFSPATSVITEVNRRVFGASPLDFQECARRALRGEKKPGVIMIANSARKAAAVLSAIRNGCVSTLIIDKELADEIERLVPELKEFIPE